MVDYKTKVHNMYLNGNFSATDRLNFMGNVIVNLSNSKYDQVIMPTLPSEITDVLSHQDFGFEGMDAYSDLDYNFYQFGLGLEYFLSKGVTYTASAEYYDLVDDAPYVYGDETGSMLVLRTGIRVEF
jgi:hypothetical protein